MEPVGEVIWIERRDARFIVRKVEDRDQPYTLWFNDEVLMFGKSMDKIKERIEYELGMIRTKVRGVI